MRISAADAGRLVLADFTSSDPDVPWEITDIFEDDTQWAIAVNDGRANDDPSRFRFLGMTVVSKRDGALSHLGGLESGAAGDRMARVGP